MNKTYKIITYGCQMNENDSEKISGMLKEMGYTPTDDEKTAGVVVMNTCSVRENADERFFGNVGNFKHIKKKNPDLILAVCGCMISSLPLSNKLKKKIRRSISSSGRTTSNIFRSCWRNSLKPAVGQSKFTMTIRGWLKICRSIESTRLKATCRS